MHQMEIYANVPLESVPTWGIQIQKELSKQILSRTGAFLKRQVSQVFKVFMRFVWRFFTWKEIYRRLV